MGVGSSSPVGGSYPQTNWQVYEQLLGATDHVTALAVSHDGLWIYAGSKADA